MIYLDVTSACRSALNTGVKRVQRGLHGFLQARPDYRPVCWESRRHRYRLLDDNDRAILHQTRTPSGLALFDSFAPGAWKDWTAFLRPRSRPAALPRFHPGDLLLLPDLLWDNRARHLPAQATAGVRRIGVFHDAIALHPPVQSRIDRYFCRRAMTALAAFDGVLCVSREAESDLHSFWHQNQISPTPTLVAPWPVPFPGGRPAAQLNFAARRILCLARLEPHKNHLRLLDACETLWNDDLSFELQLIGCLAYPDTAWRILRRVRRLQRSGRAITWQAHIDEAGLHQAYRNCSFTAFPSLREGFGLPILESLWHGRPVVCGANGALGEVATGGGVLAVDTSSVASIASGLRSLLASEAEYQSLSAASQNRSFRTWVDYWREVAPFCRPPVTEPDNSPSRLSKTPRK